MSDSNDLRDMTRTFLEGLFQGVVEEEDEKDSLLIESSYGSAMLGGRDQYDNYRHQHVEELASIVEQYPDMAESETDLRRYWEGVVGDALKLAFGGESHQEMPALQAMVLKPPGKS